MGVPTYDPRFAWLSRFADELLALRPNFSRDALLVEAERAYEGMAKTWPPEEAAHLWGAEDPVGPHDECG